jgi:hypothetical protein
MNASGVWIWLLRRARQDYRRGARDPQNDSHLRGTVVTLNPKHRRFDTPRKF